MLIGMSHTTVLQELEKLQPLQLKAVTLLRQNRPDYTQDELTTATEELRDYTDHCQRVAASLKSLPPVPVLDVSMIEAFAL